MRLGQHEMIAITDCARCPRCEGAWPVTADGNLAAHLVPRTRALCPGVGASVTPDMQVSDPNPEN